jgi:hypothetical protein
LIFLIKNKTNLWQVGITDVFTLEDNEWKIIHHHEGIVPEEHA